MAIWFHSAVLATTLAATAAIGIAAAAVYADRPDASSKGDRLIVSALAAPDFVTIERRGEGISVLTRVPVTLAR